MSTQSIKTNMSALLLEKNGRVSSSKRIKHMKAKYFLIKDYCKAGEFDVGFCPTNGMWADILTKPLQGQKFRDMRAFLQNCARNYDEDIELNETMNLQDVASSGECVGEHAKFPATKPTMTASTSHQPYITCVSQVTWGSDQVIHQSQVAPTGNPTKDPTSEGSHKESQV